MLEEVREQGPTQSEGAGGGRAGRGDGVKAVRASVAQSCPVLCDLVDCSPPSSSVHGILQARILEWVAMPFSRGSSPPRDQTGVSCTASRFFTL